MMVLATDNPRLKVMHPGLDEGRVIVIVPSGKDDLQIAMSLHQALQLMNGLRVTINDTLTKGFAAPSARVVKFAKRKQGRA